MMTVRRIMMFVVLGGVLGLILGELVVKPLADDSKQSLQLKPNKYGEVRSDKAPMGSESSPTTSDGAVVTTGFAASKGTRIGRKDHIVKDCTEGLPQWSAVKVRHYNVIWQEGKRVVLGSNIYQTTLKLPPRSKNERYLVVYYKGEGIEEFWWRDKKIEEPEDGIHLMSCSSGFTVYVVPKEMFASRYWKEIKIKWVDPYKD